MRGRDFLCYRLLTWDYDSLIYSGIFWLFVLKCRYKLGFCPNGPDCRYRHTRVPGPPPPVEEVLQKIQQLASHNFGYSNRFFQNRNANSAPQVEKTQIGLGPNVVNQATKATMKGSPISQQQHQQQVQQPQQGSQAPNLLNAPQNQANRSAIPLPQGTSRCVQSFKVFN